jgi:internalin A
MKGTGCLVNRVAAGVQTRQKPKAATGPQSRFPAENVGGLRTMSLKTGWWCVAFVIAGLMARTAVAADIEFPDPNLDQVIREILKKKQIDKLDKSKKITDEDVSTIFFLEFPNRGIENLAGLEKCKNLAQVKLTGNKIKDLKPLEECVNIQSLDLAKNQIADITPLSKLVKLQYLQLEDNQITAIDAVAPLKALTALYLSRNQVVSLEPVAGLPKLTSLYLEKNKVADVAPLKSCKWLQSIDLKGNQVKDVSPLAALTEQRWTLLDGNQITDIAALVEAAKKDAGGDKRFAPYWNLHLTGNPLSDAAKGQVAELKTIGVRLKAD